MCAKMADMYGGIHELDCSGRIGGGPIEMRSNIRFAKQRKIRRVLANLDIANSFAKQEEDPKLSH